MAIDKKDATRENLLGRKPGRGEQVKGDDSIDPHVDGAGKGPAGKAPDVRVDPAEGQSGGGAEDFLREHGGEVDRGDRGESGPADTAIKDTFGDAPGGYPGHLDSDAQDDQGAVEDLLDPDLPSKEDGSPWAGGDAGWQDAPGRDGGQSPGGPSMGDIAAGGGHEMTSDGETVSVDHRDRFTTTDADFTEVYVADEAGLHRLPTEGDEGNQSPAPSSLPESFVVVSSDENDQQSGTETFVDREGNKTVVDAPPPMSSEGDVEYFKAEDGQWYAVDGHNNSFPVDEGDVPAEARESQQPEADPPPPSGDGQAEQQKEEKKEDGSKDDGNKDDGKQEDGGGTSMPDPENYEDEQAARAREQREQLDERFGNNDGTDVFERRNESGDDVDPNEHEAVDTGGGSGVDDDDGISNPGSPDGAGTNGGGRTPGPGHRNEPDYGPDSDQVYDGQERSAADELDLANPTLNGDLTGGGGLGELDPSDVGQEAPEVVDVWSPDSDDSAGDEAVKGDVEERTVMSSDPHDLDEQVYVAEEPTIESIVQDDPAAGVDEGDFVWTDEVAADDVVGAMPALDADYGKPAPHVSASSGDSEGSEPTIDVSASPAEFDRLDAVTFAEPEPEPLILDGVVENDDGFDAVEVVVEPHAVEGREVLEG